MIGESEGRKPRADALRNRARLIGVAKQAFTEIGPEVTLEEIARRAEVGIGTLYRHFPTRDAMVEAVYRHEVGQLAEAAQSLLETLPPAEALRAWLRLFVEYMATKRVIAPALGAMAGGVSALYETSGSLIRAAVTLLIERAIAAGDIRADIEPEDLMQALSGLSYGASAPGWDARTLRLIDVLMNGLRPEA
ncbi:TetR/AcrR family transcriptional regulator [Phenylobacterium sp.]|uniref:TetR/AcrR family transcriptional regulator n=1 Tax=Phenylobacterium sp. TaxID=1871053 RepID=UPI00121E639E|nr:TetR/AcrR family transcriptional regulator [Phenylobacterium sp.]THD62962.1 MAG: TetR/AcrR family transcriptional regulator [Phenylobacterium sp.]